MKAQSEGLVDKKYTWIWPWHKAGKWDRSALLSQKPKKYSHNYIFRRYLENSYDDEHLPTQSTYCLVVLSSTEKIFEDSKTVH